MITVTEEFKHFIETYFTTKKRMQASMGGASMSGSFNGTSPISGRYGIGSQVIDSQYASLLLDYGKKYSNPEIIAEFGSIIYAYGNEPHYATPESGIPNKKPDECKEMFANLDKAIKEALGKNPRSKVIGKHYNFINNEFEYELESGDFIPCVNSPQHKHHIPSEVFPLEFLVLYDTALHRNAVINDIVN